MSSEQELRAFCAVLVADRGEPEDGLQLAADPALAAEVKERLAACGLRLHLEEGGRPLAVIVEDGTGLAELALAILARCALTLAEASAGQRARLPVRTLWEEFGRPHGYTEAFLRRSGLGPLETRGLVRVVKPEQRAAEAYVVAGPALAAIDTAGLRARLEAAA